MKRFVLRRLFVSFSELDRAIRDAKASFEQQENPPIDILTRINSYEDILAKQKVLVGELCKEIRRGNGSEATRLIKLINGLSQMIRDDARGMIEEDNRDEVHHERQPTIM